MPAFTQLSDGELEVRRKGSRFALAGWMGIVAAVLFPLSFVTGIVQAIVGAKALGYKGPMIGPGDAIGIIFTLLVIYVLVSFRRLLNERYDFHDVNTLITLSIAWSVLFTLASLGTKLGIFLLWPLSRTALLLIQGSVMSVAMISTGIIDILLGVKIVKAETHLPDLIKAFGYLSLVAGIAEVSVFLSFFALPLVPVNCVLLGIILLKDRESAEFV